MIVIDVPGDLNAEDDRGLGVARMPSGRTFAAGDVVVAGVPGFWSWAIVDEVADGFIYFRCVEEKEAARRAELVALPATG